MLGVGFGAFGFGGWISDSGSGEAWIKVFKISVFVFSGLGCRSSKVGFRFGCAGSVGV